MKFLRPIYYFALLTLLYSCGGGSPNTNTQTPSLPKTDNSMTNELALKRLKGIWKGSLITFISGSTTKQCEWDITLHLTSTKVDDSNKIIGGVFLGSASAELIFSQGKRSENCVSDSMQIDWSATCYSDEYMAIIPSYFINDNYSCSINTDDANHYQLLYSWRSFNGVLESSFLSYDKSKILLQRNNRDDPKLSLVRQ